MHVPGIALGCDDVDPTYDRWPIDRCPASFEPKNIGCEDDADSATPGDVRNPVGYAPQLS